MPELRNSLAILVRKRRGADKRNRLVCEPASKQPIGVPTRYLYSWGENSADCDEAEGIRRLIYIRVTFRLIERYMYDI